MSVLDSSHCNGVDSRVGQIVPFQQHAMKLFSSGHLSNLHTSMTLMVHPLVDQLKWLLKQLKWLVQQQREVHTFHVTSIIVKYIWKLLVSYRLNSVHYWRPVQTISHLTPFVIEFVCYETLIKWLVFVLNSYIKSHFTCLNINSHPVSHSMFIHPVQCSMFIHPVPCSMFIHPVSACSITQPHTSFSITQSIHPVPRTIFNHQSYAACSSTQSYTACSSTQSYTACSSTQSHAVCSSTQSHAICSFTQSHAACSSTQCYAACSSLQICLQKFVVNASNCRKLNSRQTVTRDFSHSNIKQPMDL